MSINPESNLSLINVMTKKRFFVVFVVALLNLIAWLDEGAFNALTPIWSVTYGLNADQIAKIGSAFMLGYFPALFLAGFLGDWLGSKKILIVSFIGVLITAACMLLVKSYEMLYLRNILFGVCSGIIWGPAMRWLAMWLPAKERLRYGGGMFVAGAQLAVAISAPLALMLSTIMNWQNVFLLVTILGIPILLIMMFGTTERPEKRPGISQPELNYIYSDAVSAEQLKAEKFSWAVLLKSLQNPSVWTMCIASGCIVGSSWVTTIWSSVAFMTAYGLSAQLTSVLMCVGTLIAMLAGVYGARITGVVFKGNLRHALATAAVMGGIGYLGAGLLHPNYLVFVLFNTILGLGMCGVWFGNLGAYFAILEKPEYGGTLNGIAAGMSVLFGYILILQSGKWMNPAVTGIAMMSKIYTVAGVLCLLTIVFVYLSKSINTKAA